MIFAWSVKIALPIIIGKCTVVAIDKALTNIAYPIHGIYISVTHALKNIVVIVQNSVIASRQCERVEAVRYFNGRLSTSTIVTSQSTSLQPTDVDSGTVHIIESGLQKG